MNAFFVWSAEDSSHHISSTSVTTSYSLHSLLEKEPMATPPWVCVCSLGFISIFIHVQPAVQTCTELELQNIKDDEKPIKVKENSLFTLSVVFNTLNCQGKWNWSLVKLSALEKGIHVDLCKFILRERTCNVTISSSSCTCSGGRYLQFSKRVTQEDNKIFAWKWSDSQSKKEEKQREITLFVEASRNKPVVTNVFISCLVVGVILSVLVALVITLRIRMNPKETYDNAVADSTSQPQLPTMSVNQRHGRGRNLHQVEAYNHLH